MSALEQPAESDDKDNPPARKYPAPGTTPDWGDVFTCAMAACTGQPNCPWSPYTCRLLGGES